MEQNQLTFFIQVFQCMKKGKDLSRKLSQALSRQLTTFYTEYLKRFYHEKIIMVLPRQKTVHFFILQFLIICLHQPSLFHQIYPHTVGSNPKIFCNIRLDKFFSKQSNFNVNQQQKEKNYLDQIRLDLKVVYFNVKILQLRNNICLQCL